MLSHIIDLYLNWSCRKEIKEHEQNINLIQERIRVKDVQIRAIHNSVRYTELKRFVKERPDLIYRLKSISKELK